MNCEAGFARSSSSNPFMRGGGRVSDPSELTLAGLTDDRAGAIVRHARVQLKEAFRPSKTADGAALALAQLSKKGASTRELRDVVCSRWRMTTVTHRCQRKVDL